MEVTNDKYTSDHSRSNLIASGEQQAPEQITNDADQTLEVPMGSSSIAKAAARAAVVTGFILASSLPVMAQNALSSTAATGNQTNNTGYFTGAQTMQGGSTSAPILQGATNGTIASQGSDATIIMGVNTSGTVRVNNLANLEALLNIIANGMEILGIAWGGPCMIWGFMNMAAGVQDSLKRIIWGAAGVTGGLATPGCINWLVASCRDASLFS